MRKLASKFGSVPFITPWLVGPRILIGYGSLLFDKTIQISSILLGELCFSPDGKLLAALATDEVIRVCSGPSITTVSQFLFSGQDAQCTVAFGALGLGYRQEAN